MHFERETDPKMIKDHKEKQKIDDTIDQATARLLVGATVNHRELRYVGIENRIKV